MSVPQDLALSPPPNPHSPYFIHRSGTETLWTCQRKYFFEYLYGGTGVRKSPTKIQLVIGSAVHVGLGCMCDVLKAYGVSQALLPATCSSAIDEAINYFQHTDTFQHLKEHERREQETLIAGLLWSFFYYSWAAFVATYEVLCVERAQVDHLIYSDPDMPEFYISSRPDVIVRHRVSNEFIGISWKTIDDLSEYKRWNFRVNLQNLAETHYGEQILSDILENEYEFAPNVTGLRGRALMEAMERAVAEFRALPREISHVQTIFLVKGPRQCELLDGTVINWEDGNVYEDRERTWRQQSMLCYRYVNGGALPDPNAPPKKGKKTEAEKLFESVSWSYRYFKAGNKNYNNLGGDWLRQPLWEADTTIQEWVQALNSGEVFPSCGALVSHNGVLDPRNVANPLSKVVIWDEPMERNASLMAETVAEVESVHYQAVKRGLISPGVYDINAFPRSLSTCHNSAPSAGVPVRCEYRDVCYNPMPELLIQIDGDAGFGAKWVKRVPHHEVERESFAARGLL